MEKKSIMGDGNIMKRIDIYILFLQIFSFASILYFDFSPFIITLLFLGSVALLGIKLYFLKKQGKVNTCISLLLATLCFIIHIGGYLLYGYELVTFNLKNWNYFMMGIIIIFLVIVGGYEERKRNKGADNSCHNGNDENNAL